MKISLEQAFAVALFSSSLMYAQVATDTKKAAEDTGHATKVAAQDTGHATKVAAQDTAKGTEKAADKTADATTTAAKKTGHVTKVAAQDTAHGTEKAADKTADATSTAAKKRSSAAATSCSCDRRSGESYPRHRQRDPGHHGGYRPAALQVLRSVGGVFPAPPERLRHARSQAQALGRDRKD